METTESTERGRDPLTAKVIGCAIEVHRHLGPGLLESAYEKCFAYELNLAKVAFRVQAPMPVDYKNVKLDCGFRVDILVQDRLIVELKAVDQIHPIQAAQILTYMKLARASVGLLINFHVRQLIHGIHRFAL